MGRVTLDPTPDSGVVGGEAPLREEFLDVPIGKGEPQVPAHRTGDDGGFEVAPFEQRWPWFAHKGSISGPRQPPPHGFATLLSALSILNVVILEIELGKVILPIWHKVTKDEVVRNYPNLADRYALNTATATIPDIALEVAITVYNSVRVSVHSKSSA